jgi:activating signal cointegrator complex subunit 3
VEQRVWPDQSPLLQFPNVSPDAVARVIRTGLPLTNLYELSLNELVNITRAQRGAQEILKALRQLPRVEVTGGVQPVTRTIVRLTVSVRCLFVWSDAVHGGVQPYYILIMDNTYQHIYHSEYLMISKKMAGTSAPHVMTFTVPVRGGGVKMKFRPHGFSPPPQIKKKY